MPGDVEEQIRAYVEYFRDLGVHDFYRVDGAGAPAGGLAASGFATSGLAALGQELVPAEAVRVAGLREAAQGVAGGAVVVPVARAASASIVAAAAAVAESSVGEGATSGLKLISFNDLAPLPGSRVAPAERARALQAIRDEIGDCTRCPLAYAGRRNIVFADGDANARLMFVGEGPGADEDASGVPFVGKAGQLLNNMIVAMGLKREQVYIANIVKCRPPANRVPEPVEANTCAQFLLRQIDVVQPQVIVALGATAAMYLLGMKQPLAALRGRWHSCRGAKLAVTYHPAFLLRDPRQKGEAWKDLQMVMGELGLQPAKRG